MWVMSKSDALAITDRLGNFISMCGILKIIW
jgi:hypothetical protein